MGASGSERGRDRRGLGGGDGPALLPVADSVGGRRRWRRVPRHPRCPAPAGPAGRSGPVRDGARGHGRLARGGQPDRGSAVLAGRGRAAALCRLAHRDAPRQRRDLQRAQGAALRHHPGPDRRHRRQGPLHVRPFRTGRTDRGPNRGGARGAEIAPQRPLPHRTAARRGQDRDRRRGAPQAGAALRPTSSTRSSCMSISA